MDMIVKVNKFSEDGKEHSTAIFEDVNEIIVEQYPTVFLESKNKQFSFQFNVPEGCYLSVQYK